MTTKTPATSPTQIYLAGLSEGSQQGMRQSLEIIAGILNANHDADSFPWCEVTYADSMAVRIALTQRYRPATVNKMLSALRGRQAGPRRLALGLELEVGAEAQTRGAAPGPDPAAASGRARRRPARRTPRPRRPAARPLGHPALA